jgi:hypothetical protein
MAFTEQQRLEMHLGLRKVRGDDVADAVIEHLPPSGWGDVARKHDITIGLALFGMQVQIMLSLAG